MHRKASQEHSHGAQTIGANLLAIAAMAVGMVFVCWPGSLRAQQVVEPQGLTHKPSVNEQTSPQAEQLPPVDYTISPGDQLEVYVVAVPELSRTYRVDPQGRITLPMLDRPVSAEGLTPDELSDAISQDLVQQGLLSHPDVLVTVQSSPSNSIAVTGSVAKPGMYPVYGETTILDVLTEAGGISAGAGSTAIVMRGAKAMQLFAGSASSDARDDPQQAARMVKIPVRHLLDTGDEQQNLTLYPGDRIDVPRAGIVYVVGAVNRAGGFALTGEQGRLTVLQAVALAGNVSHTAKLHDTVIIRQNSKSLTGHEQIEVDLKKILSGKAPDRTLQAGDILFVPNSTGKQVLARALAAITTVAIYRVPF